MDRRFAPAPGAGRLPLRGRVLAGAGFFLSGAAGLVYQVVWSRRLQLVLGSTTEAVGLVLAVFMAGLGLGALLLGRRIDRSPAPLRLYALLELGIGALGLASLPLLAAGEAGYLAVARALPDGVPLGPLKALLAALVLLPPCLLMGATFPALLKAVSRTPEGARRSVGSLYALNLAGAVAGTLATGLVLVEAVGLRRSALAAAGVNLAVAAAFLLARRAGWFPGEGSADGGASPAEAGTTGPAGIGAGIAELARAPAGRHLLLGLFVSGATTMAWEVVLTRVLGMVFGVSSYAFTVVLAVFLLGLGLGALGYELGLRGLRGRAGNPAAFAWSQVAVAFAGAAVVAAVPVVPRLVAYLRQVPGLGFGEVLAAKAAIAAALILPLAALAGLGVPLLLGALAGDVGRLGRSVGAAYLVNTLGTIAGSLGAGFLLVGSIGTEGSLRATAAASAAVGALGVAALARTAAARVAGAGLAAAALAAALASPRWPAALFLSSDSNERGIAATRFAIEERLRGSPAEVLFLREGRNAAVAVTQSLGGRTLVTSGHPDASDGGDMGTQMIAALIPLAAHPRPERVMVVGLGAGVTAGTALRFPEVRRLEVVEIERAVVDAAPLFAHVNGGIERDPRTRVVVDDGRSRALAARERFDVVISEPSNVWRAGVANLFTADFYAGARRLLRPGGIFAQWMQLYRVDHATLRTVLKTFAEAFPEAQLWWLDPGNVVILGAETAIVPDRARVDALLAGEFREDRIRVAGMGAASDLHARRLLDRAGMLALLEPGDVANTDDRPVLEFRAPRELGRPSARNAERLLAAKLRAPLAPPPLAGPEPTAAELWLGVASMYGGIPKADAEVRAALERALRAGAPPLARVRAAEAALAGGDAAAAAALLDGVAPGAGDRDLARELAYARAHLLAAAGRIDEALTAYRETGELAGEAGLEALAVLQRTRHASGALELAELLLRAARPGGAVGAPGVVFVYRALADLASREGQDFAARSLDLVLRLPAAEGDFARYPRLRAVAAIAERAGDPARALAACEEAARRGVLDLELMRQRIRLLRTAGRPSEAAELALELGALAPEAALDPVESPLAPSGKGAGLETISPR